MRVAAAAVIVLLLAGCGKQETTSQDETPRAILRAEPLHFLPGETVDVSLKVLHRAAEKAEPEATEEVLGRLTVLEGPVVRSKQLPGGWQETLITWKLTGYLPGPVTIGPISVLLAGKRGLSSASVALTIDDPLQGRSADLEDLRPAKGLFGIPRAALKELLFWAAGIFILLAVLIVGAIVWLVKRRKPALTAEQQLSAAERAFKALDALREMLPTLTEFKPLYYEMNLVLRRYIEEEFRFAASRETTEEFLESARRGLPLRLQKGLGEYFEACDLVKYAGYPVDRNAAAGALATAAAFVKTAAGLAEAQHAASPGEAMHGIA